MPTKAKNCQRIGLHCARKEDGSTSLRAFSGVLSLGREAGAEAAVSEESRSPDIPAKARTALGTAS